MRKPALRSVFCILLCMGVLATIVYFEMFSEADVVKKWFFWSAGMFVYIVIWFVILRIIVGDGDDMYRTPLLPHVTHSAMLESTKRQHYVG